MLSMEVREAFLNFFKNKDHRIIPSSSLVPSDDPTLLFTNAGMVQFKKIFLGEETVDFTRATTVQKCVRAGGKHNDLENVGRTARHHTFFEMLGNFSFGDYFKEGAIEMAWELVTRVFGLDPSRLWVTIFREDDEAFELWKKIAGIPEGRIIRLGEKDNFWAMGDTGPCGPCSEIVYDQGEGVGCGRTDCSVECDCDRYLELWNLVFMQYNRSIDGKLSPLPKPSIDTGMGLERTVAVLQGVNSNFEIDIFRKIIDAIEELTGRNYGIDEKADTSMRVIADHSRAVAFIITDGVLPSNEGRGYVLRRIMRRASRHGRFLGLHDAFLFRMTEVVADVMGDVYPELRERKEYVSKIVKMEEERFSETLDRGLRLLGEEIERLRREGSRSIPGEIVFKLYDTHGFPIDLTSDIARDQGMVIDEDGFRIYMEQQRHRARISWKATIAEEKEIYRDLSAQGIKTNFVGYEKTRTEARIVAIIKDNSWKESMEAGEEAEIILDVTPFYGESGGQIGDRGVIEKKGEAVFEVKDTVLPVSGITAHRGLLIRGRLTVGDRINAILDTDFRIPVQHAHTATHLLHAALREILGDHVKQAGSWVGPDRLRFDFTHFAPLKKEEIEKIEDIVNENIIRNKPVLVHYRQLRDALDMGAVALFDEKYGERVRVIEIPDVSMELCGGTHVHRTGDIGMLKILNDSSVASGIRRIQAITGRECIAFVRKQENTIREIAELLKGSEGEIKSRMKKLLEQMKEMEKEIEAYRRKEYQRKAGELMSTKKVIGGRNVVSCFLEGYQQDALREISDYLRDKMKSGIVVLGGSKDNKVFLLVALTDDLEKILDARDIIEKGAPLIRGRGGGRRDLAQAGGDDISKIQQAIVEIEGYIASLKH